MGILAEFHVIHRYIDPASFFINMESEDVAVGLEDFDYGLAVLFFSWDRDDVVVRGSEQNLDVSVVFHPLRMRLEDGMVGLFIVLFQSQGYIRLGRLGFEE